MRFDTPNEAAAVEVGSILLAESPELWDMTFPTGAQLQANRLIWQAEVSELFVFENEPAENAV